ncbi:MAG: hypothetical protein OEW24_05205 [Chloroflexota bacterium]|nr:hypothetical protein [Chloroflexota bacterium]
MRRRAVVTLLAVTLVACAAPVVSPSESPSSSAAAHSHDSPVAAVKADLTDIFGMTFSPAGPHHEIGRAPNGVELDLVGVPVEEIVLSLPTADRVGAIAAGRGYVPYLAELLGGPTSAWDWVRDQLECRADTAATCGQRLARAHLAARFTADGGEDYVVLVVTVEP